MKRKIYMQPKLVLTIGDKTATLKNVSIFPGRMNSGIDELYGNLGQDFVAGFQSFTVDFTKMRFSLGNPLTAQDRQYLINQAVRARLTGEFPGSPVELDHIFKLSNNKIASLEIRS